MSLMSEAWNQHALLLIVCAYMFAAVAIRTAPPHQPRARVMKYLTRVSTWMFILVPLIWIVTGALASIVLIPLLFLVGRHAEFCSRKELYQKHVVGPSVREVLRKYYGSATTADLEEYLAEKKKQMFFAPEVEQNLKFRSKQKQKF